VQTSDDSRLPKACLLTINCCERVFSNDVSATQSFDRLSCNLPLQRRLSALHHLKARSVEDASMSAFSCERLDFGCVCCLVGVKSNARVALVASIVFTSSVSYCCRPSIGLSAYCASSWIALSNSCLIAIHDMEVTHIPLISGTIPRELMITIRV
jgi:hypothetical protein